jgi:hypothetical protein
MSSYSTADEYLSNSRSYVFNNCKKMFDYKYVQRIRPAAKGMHFDSWERMLRGVVIHAGIEAGFLGEDVAAAVRTACAKERAKGLSQEQQNALLVLQNESPIVCQNLLDWLPASDWEPVTYRGRPMVEARLEWPLAGWKGFLGFADLVAKHKPTGRVMVLDWKTRESFEEQDLDIFNTQFLLYSYVLDKMGVEIHGSLLVEAKPTPPKRAPRTVRDDIGGIDGVRISTDGRFRSTPTFRSRTYLENGWKDFEVQARQIADFRPEQAYRSMSGFKCKTCEFKQLCQGQLNNYDVAHIAGKSYEVPNTAILME